MQPTPIQPNHLTHQCIQIEYVCKHLTGFQNLSSKPLATSNRIHLPMPVQDRSFNWVCYSSHGYQDCQPVLKSLTMGFQPTPQCTWIFCQVDLITWPLLDPGGRVLPFPQLVNLLGLLDSWSHSQFSKVSQSTYPSYLLTFSQSQTLITLWFNRLWLAGFPSYTSLIILLLVVESPILF